LAEGVTGIPSQWFDKLPLRGPVVQTPQGSRAELIEAWRLKVSYALDRYHAARAECYRRIGEMKKELAPSPDVNDAYLQAQSAESIAREEYHKMLAIFQRLMVNGTDSRRPESGSD
jgi:hypothetical protein